jgi:proline racemase
MPADAAPKTPGRQRSLELIDTQAGGDVSRILLDGVAPLPGDSVHAQQQYLEENGDGLRRLLLSEPYGHPSQSINLIVRPCDARAQAGYIIMEAMGYPMYSGSNTICTATALLQSGRIPMADGEQTVQLESPAGVTRVRAQCGQGLVQSVTTEGEAAYLIGECLAADVPRYGRVGYDLVWSGGLYVMIDAQAREFDLTHDEESALAAFAHALVETIHPDLAERFPEFSHFMPPSFVHFMGCMAHAGNGVQARSATYVHPHVICRSPTGTGTSARLALVAERGEFKSGQCLETISPRGNRFTGTLVGEAEVGGRRAWETTITGRAWTLARAHTVIHLDDPLVDNRDLEQMLSGGE